MTSAGHSAARPADARWRFACYLTTYLDVCFGLGFCFDDGEIQEILELVAPGGLEEARDQYERSRQRRRKRARRQREAVSHCRVGYGESDLIGALIFSVIDSLTD